MASASTLRRFALPLALLASCTQPRSDYVPAQNDGLVPAAAYGELPTPPGKQTIRSPGGFISLYAADGRRSGKTNRDKSAFAVGGANGDDGCLLPKGLALRLTARVTMTSGSVYYIAGLSAPCSKVKGSGPLTDSGDQKPSNLQEGFIAASDVDEDQPKKSLQPDDDDQEATTPVASDLENDEVGCTSAVQVTRFKRLDGSDSIGDEVCGMEPQDNGLFKRCTILGTMIRMGGSMDTQGINVSAVMRVKGNAAKWRVKTERVTTTADFSMPWDRTVDVGPPNTLSADIDATGAVTDVHFKDIITDLEKVKDWHNSYVRFTISALDANGAPGGEPCIHEFGQHSPIVLDFSGADTLATVPHHESAATFDFDGSGRRWRTGWIYPHAAFLALDLNDNGVIDSGLELFGTDTETFGRKAQNGYEALAALDANGDRVIDARDPAFKRLRLWIDVNMDGMTQPGELVDLPSRQVESLTLDYETLVGAAASPLANDAPYRARFTGPANCPKGGCYTFDVYFATSW